MIIRSFSRTFKSLLLFIQQTDISEGLRKSPEVVECIKFGKKLTGSHILVLLFLFPLALVQAQIQTDGSLGLAQKLNGPNYMIDEGLGKRAGNNLFHSFSEFNINQGESATFRGANEIANVISRVTGGRLSTIDGFLKSEIKNANFYLINSAGVLFGPNASLSINGSFHTSTADYVRFGDADLFYSKPLQGEILSTAAPAAFGFFGLPQGNITVAGSQLNMDEQATFSLSGGEITLTDGASIYVPQGQIDVVSVNSAGETVFSTSAGYQNPTVSAFAKLNDVNIVNHSELNVDGEGGGRVVIRGGQLVLEDSVLSARTKGDRDGRGVDIVTDRFDFVRSRLDTTTMGIGNAGEIRTMANQVNVLGEVAIEAVAVLPENNGTIDLSSPELTLNGFNADFQVNSGKGEFIRLTGGSIVLDGSFNPDLDGVALDGPVYSIEADWGEIAGKNLFYSFREFLVDKDETALFRKSEQTENVSNIITRITGSKITSVYGEIESEIPGASLYLINPNGVFFGSDSTLSLPGSFHMGTADYLTLANGGRFDVSDPARSVLNSGELSAYGFTDNEIGEIAAESSLLRLSENSILSLVGGNLWLKDTRLRAPYGHINLVSLQSAGEASILNGSNDLDVSHFSALGDIIVDDSVAAVNDTTGLDDLDSNSVGRLFVRGNDLRLDNNGYLRARNLTAEGAGGSIDVLVSGELFIGKNSDISIAGRGELGQISIVAENITIDGAGQNKLTGIDVSQSGEAGISDNNLRVTVAQNMNIINGGVINLANFSDASGGNARIEARDLIIDKQNSDDFTGIFSATDFGSGDGGELKGFVEELLQINNGAFINSTTYARGDGGKIIIQAKNLIIENQSAIFSATIPGSEYAIFGNGGELDINVEEHLQILNGGAIDVSTASTGNAGVAKVRAKNLTIDGQGSGFASIGSAVVFDSTGNGGELDINVKEHLQILNSGSITTSNFSTGNAGSATIQAKNLTIDGQDYSFAGISSIAGSDSNSNGGNLDIKVTESLEMINGGDISAFAEKGNAGNLSILAGGNIRIIDSLLSISAGQEDFDVNSLSNFLTPEIFIEAGDSIYIQNSTFSTNAGVLGSERGAGGDIYLLAPVEIWLENSTLLAQAGYAGGNVFIDPIRYIVISSDVIAQADVQGGNYSVIVTKPSGWIQSTDSQINLSGRQSGSVLSNTSPFDLGAELSDLTLDFLNVENWVSQPCKFRLGGTGSSFVVTGWKGVSNNTDDFLPSEPILLADYNLSETEPTDEAFLQEAIFYEVDDGCEDCP